MFTLAMLYLCSTLSEGLLAIFHFVKWKLDLPSIVLMNLLITFQ